MYECLDDPDTYYVLIVRKVVTLFDTFSDNPLHNLETTQKSQKIPQQNRRHICFGHGQSLNSLRAQYVTKT